MSSQLSELETGIIASRERVNTLFDEGRNHLATMRRLVSAPGAVEPRSDEFSAEVVALSGVITSLEQTSIAPSVKRAAEDLSLGFIAPVADGQAADLANRQDQVMQTIRTSVAAQSQVLSQAADEILAREPVSERRFVPLSSAEAVLRYAADFIPAWAGAISIDLLPAVLVFILTIVHGAIRRQEQRLPFAERITAAELLEALEVQRALGRQGIDVEQALRAAEREDEQGPADSNVTSLDTSAKSPRKGTPP